MNDLVERLRERGEDKFIRDAPLMAEAADEIERLRRMYARACRIADIRQDQIEGLRKRH